MAAPIDSTRSAASALPPAARLLADAALQRPGASLGPALGAELAGSASADTGASGWPVGQVPPATAPPVAPDTSRISPEARAQLGATFDPQRQGGGHGGALGGGGAQRAAGPVDGAAVSGPGGGLLPGAAALGTSSGAATQAASGAWPAGGPGAAWMGLAGAVVEQLTAGVSPQRVVAAQAWPLGLAQALESGALGDEMPPLQTWLVRQGQVRTADGPRGVSATLRVPVPWLALAPAAAPGGLPQGAGALQLPFAGSAQALQSGVLALVLQGTDPQAARTSALLVLDFQPLAPAMVYGRDMLQARLDPWTQMAVLQASGQVPREDEASGRGVAALCDTVGCPYASRAVCVQPFCHAMRGIPPAGPAVPLGPSD